MLCSYLRHYNTYALFVAPTCDILVSPEAAVLQKLLVAEAGSRLLVVIVDQAEPVPGRRRRIVVLQRRVAQSADTRVTQVTGQHRVNWGRWSRVRVIGHYSRRTPNELRVTVTKSEMTVFWSR